MKTLSVPDFLEAIGRLETRVVEATRRAESRCSVILLHLHSDGSGRVVYRWTQRSRRQYSDPFASAVADLVATAEAKDLQETADDFESLEELEVYLKERNVL